MMASLDEDYRDESGTITICMYCRRVKRNTPEGPRWEVVEEFITNPPRGISHGLCPDCLEKHYPPSSS